MHGNRILFTVMVAALLMTTTGCTIQGSSEPAATISVAPLPQFACGNRVITFADAIPLSNRIYQECQGQTEHRWFVDGLVYAVYEPQPWDPSSLQSQLIVVVGGRKVPEGRDPSAQELIPVRIDRQNGYGVGPGEFIGVLGGLRAQSAIIFLNAFSDDSGREERIMVRGMYPACQGPNFLNIAEALNQEFRDKRGRWHDLIEPFVKSR